MATTKKTEPVSPPAPAPQPTHGGVYELVNGQLRAIEGGPPPKTDAPPPAAATVTEGEGA